MSTDLENEIEKELKESDNILLSLYPAHRFYIVLIFVIGVLLLSALFMYINQDNPEIQKGILGFLVGGAGGGAGGYIGARIKAK